VYAPQPVPAIRRPPRRHWGRRLLITLIVLVGLLVAADRIGLLVAERTAGNTIRTSQNLDSTPSVSVAGFPFLTQLGTGHFKQITVKAKDVPVGTSSRTLNVAAVTVVLHDVRVARDLSRVQATSATAAATISYADLSHTLGITVAYGGTSSGVGRVQATASVTVLGQSISGSVSAGVQVTGDTLKFVDPAVNGTNLPSAAVPLLQQIYGVPLALSGLPFNVKVAGVAATPDGIVIDLSGADLTYVR
jgi:hypothetical protein